MEVQRGPFVRELLGRSDYAIISQLVEPDSLVLDLGCGDGALLGWLAENKNVDARGLELDSSKVKQAIARGLSVYQGDIDQGLTDYPEQAFDYVILSQTLQETRRPLAVLREMLRVGRHAIVAFPNFGHWRVRWAHLWTGRAPRTKLFPHSWYDSPNIHFLTVKDFEELSAQEGCRLQQRIFQAGHRTIPTNPNLFAEVAAYVVCCDPGK
ncbi:MAG: methionine biosynthesis protein MetW [bacterium]|nr:methionine biosynthesis protein MetW [bacterium]